MTMLTENVILSDENTGGGYFIPPRVPQGLAAAVESLTREVIRQRPKDIYTFAAQHFQNLLRQREYCNYNKNNNYEYDGESEMSYNEIVKINKKYDKDKIKNNNLIKTQLKQNNGQNFNIDSDITICPKITTGINAGADMKIDLKKNIISQSNNKFTINSNTDLVKKRVINKFSTVKSLNDLQEFNYVTQVQEIIDHTARPILNKKLELLKKGNNSTNDNFKAKLDETCNLLQDISSCFPSKNNINNRPHSADSATHYDKRFVTEKLQMMLSETHDLLLDISTNYLNNTHSSATGSTKITDKNNIDISSTLPAVRSPILSSSTNKGNAITQNNGNVKNISSSFALPPVINNCTNCTVPITGQSVKTEDFTLPLLSSSMKNTMDNADTMKITNKIADDSNIHDTVQESLTVLDDQEITEHADNGSQSPKPKTTINVKSRNNSIEFVENLITDGDNQTDKMTNDVIISTTDDCNNHDPSLDLFGELITPVSTTAATSVKSEASSGALENVMESLVDDLSSITSIMNQAAKLHHQHADLACINEEEDATIDECHYINYINDNPNVNDIKILDDVIQGEMSNELINWQDTNTKQYDGHHNESDPSSSTKETSITDGLILGSNTNIEHSETGNEGSVSFGLCESSNEAKETTLTDGISLSLDEPMRPFIPELNLDSLQDVTVSSFKLTEDDQYDDNTNSVIETPTSSNHYNRNDVGVPQGEMNEHTFCNVEAKQMENIMECNNDKLDKNFELLSNRGDVETPLGGDISRSESRCTTRRANSGNLTWPRESRGSIIDKYREEMKSMKSNDNELDKTVNNQLELIAAISKIQAGIRGFLVRRRRRRHLKSICVDENETVSADVVTVINQDIHNKVDNIDDTFDNISIQNTKALRNDFPGYHVGKRLCRENAIIQRTTTISMEDEGNNTVADCSYLGNNSLQHTGEFHDLIVLPLYDYRTSAMNKPINSMEQTDKRTNSNILNDGDGNTSQIPTDILPMLNNECVKLPSDINSLKNFPIIHFGFNTNITDVIDHIILLSNNEILSVQDDHPDENSLRQGVIIEEITDAEIEQMQRHEISETNIETELKTMNDEDPKTILSMTNISSSSVEQDVGSSVSLSKSDDNPSSSLLLLLANTESVVETIKNDEKIIHNENDTSQ